MATQYVCSEVGTELLNIVWMNVGFKELQVLTVTFLSESSASRF
jgi:hypothetical protein